MCEQDVGGWHVGPMVYEVVGEMPAEVLSRLAGLEETVKRLERRLTALEYVVSEEVVRLYRDEEDE